MADTEHEDQAPEPGQPAKGKGKGKGPKWLNGPHRDEILVISSVALVLLGWLTLRKSGGSTAAATAPATTYAGTTAAAQSGLGAAGIVAGSDANAINGFQTYLANQSDQLAQLQSSVTDLVSAKTPANTQKPLAGSLFSPNYSGQYVQYQGGGIAEVESDGSLFGLTASQWDGALQRRTAGGPFSFDVLGGKSPQQYSTAANIATAAPAAAS